MSYVFVLSSNASYEPKCHSSYRQSQRCYLLRKMCTFSRREVGLAYHIKPLKLALLSKLSQTQSKSNCVIYLIADENGVPFLWLQVACISKRKYPLVLLQILFLPVKADHVDISISESQDYCISGNFISRYLIRP